LWLNLLLLLRLLLLSLLLLPQMRGLLAQLVAKDTSGLDLPGELMALAAAYNSQLEQPRCAAAVAGDCSKCISSSSSGR
jgi:hypothetical protein